MVRPGHRHLDATYCQAPWAGAGERVSLENTDPPPTTHTHAHTNRHVRANTMRVMLLKDPNISPHSEGGDFKTEYNVVDTKCVKKNEGGKSTQN